MRVVDVLTTMQDKSIGQYKCHLLAIQSLELASCSQGTS